MEFKSANNVFEKKDRFADEMKRFVCDEAARFTTSGNEAASASIDEFAEKGVLFSIEKNKRNIREQKQILVEIKQKEKEQKKSKGDSSINQSEVELADGVSSSGSSEPSSDSKSSSDSKEKSDSGNEASKKEKEHDNKKENAKKEKSKYE